FDIVRPFKDGLAGVAEMATRTPMTFKFRVIDRDGQTVVPGPFDNIGTFGNGVVGVSRGEKWGLIDAQGRAITPLIYDSIGTCREQRCEVQRGEQWGFIDIAGQLVIPAKYETVNAFEHGLAAVYEKTTDAAGQPVRNPRPFFIDRAGQVQFTGPASATPVIYRDVIYVESDTACGYIDRLGRVVVMAEQRGGRWVVVDTTGQVIWPAGQ
ncbi:MAG: WG repeat-containing protein, partial [Acidobacteria bacterium]|nr:WG repeat-containing protein [Acidobacteriota bacterium]